jgi:hypothetical protein
MRSSMQTLTFTEAKNLDSVDAKPFVLPPLGVNISRNLCWSSIETQNLGGWLEDWRKFQVYFWNFHCLTKRGTMNPAGYSRLGRVTTTECHLSN